MATVPALMTGEQLLDLPSDGVERWLVRGELRERPMTYRNQRHSQAEANLAYELGAWLRTRSQPRGRMVSGEAGFRIARDPDTVVGIDVAYISTEGLRRSLGSNLFEGPPVLAVEILSPSDTQERIEERVKLFLGAGVALLWLVDPGLRTVTILRPGARPVMFNEGQQIEGGPELPDLILPVGQLFE